MTQPMFCLEKPPPSRFSREEKTRPWAEKTEAYFQLNLVVNVIGHQLLSLKLSEDVSMRSKAENKGKGKGNT